MLKTTLHLVSSMILPICIILILLTAFIKKVPCYETFIEGAKDGFKTSVSLIPYLVAIMIAISMFRASGVLDWITSTWSSFFDKISVPSDIIPIIFKVILVARKDSAVKVSSHPINFKSLSLCSILSTFKLGNID